MSADSRRNVSCHVASARVSARLADIIPTMRDGARAAPERPATSEASRMRDDLACVARGALPLALVHASLYAMQLTDMCMVGLYLGTYPLTVIPRRSAPRSTGPRG